jgi:hypothetical protein
MNIQALILLISIAYPKIFFHLSCWIFDPDWAGPAWPGVQRLHHLAQATVFIFQRLQVRARKWHQAARRHRAGRGPATESPGLGGPGYGATAPPGWWGPGDVPLASSGAGSRPVAVARRGWAPPSRRPRAALASPSRRPRAALAPPPRRPRAALAPLPRRTRAARAPPP